MTRRVKAVAGTLGAVAGLWVVSTFFPQTRAASGDGKKTAIIRGTVLSVTGSPLFGILVKARGSGENYETTVVTDQHGKYVLPPLSLGSYQISVGTRWRETVQLGSSGAKQDFAVELGSGFMNQTSGASWVGVIPGTSEEKSSLATNCGECHSSWRLFDRPQTSEEGWATLARTMARVTSRGAPAAADQEYRVDLSEGNFKVLTQYLARVITPEMKEEKAAEAMIRPTEEGRRAVFTEWDLSRDVKESGIAWVDRQGTIWFNAETKKGFNGIGRLDPHTNEVKVWPSSLQHALFHDVIGDAEGNLWITASQANKIVKFDTQTDEYTLWDVPLTNSRFPHTGDFDPDGNFWFTLALGHGAVAKLDLRTGIVTEYPTLTENSEAYGLKIDREGSVWFTELRGNKLGKIDRKTGKMTEYDPPTSKAGPRRIQMDSKGRLWFTEYYVDRIGVVDPATIRFADYDIGIPGGAPYFIKVDKFDKIWFNLSSGNVIGKFDPERKKISFFLIPESDSLARDGDIDNSTNPPSIVYGRSFLAGGDYTPTVGRMQVR
jgi:virginiamycin B lyase